MKIDLFRNSRLGDVTDSVENFAKVFLNDHRMLHLGEKPRKKTTGSILSIMKKESGL